MDLNMDTLLKLINGAMGVLSIKKKLIKELRFDDGITEYNLSYDQFVDRIIEHEDIDPQSFDKNQFLQWIVKIHSEITLGFNVRNKCGKEMDYNVKLVNSCNEGELVFLFNKLDEMNTAPRVIDSLTKLYLKNGIKAIIDNEIQSPNPHPFTLIIIDVDNFKTINDMYGHLFGDHILIEVSKIFKKYFNDAYIGRIGGDEFLIVDYSDQHYDALWTKLHLMYEEIRNHNFANVESNFILKDSMEEFKLDNLNVTITSGTTRFPMDGLSYEELFSKADKALYRGKRKGKNCFIIYKDEIHGNISNNAKIETDFGYRDTLIFETLIANVCKVIGNNKNYKESISKALKIIGNYFQLDRISVYRKNNDVGEIIAFYSNPDCELASEKYLINIVEGLDEKTILKLGNFIKRVNVTNLKTQPLVYKYLEGQNVKSFAHFPLVFNNNVYGYIRFDMCQTTRTWSEEEISFYRIIAAILSLYLSK